MNESEFLESIEISEPEIPKAQYYFRYRGLDSHIAVWNYLSTFKTEKVSYCEIATTFRYDKRIRRIIYKFIGFLEEYIRAYIANAYRDRIDKLNTTPFLQGLIDREVPLHDALDNLTFNRLISQVKKLQVNDKVVIFGDLKITSRNLDAIVELRNAVSHNRFLLDERNLKKCNVDGIPSSSLRANCQNLCRHLPEQLRESFISEIKASCLAPNHTENERSEQVEWCLMNDIVIEI